MQLFDFFKESLTILSELFVNKTDKKINSKN